MKKTYTLSTQEVLLNLGVDENGLTSQQAQTRLEKFGPNKLEQAAKAYWDAIKK